MSRSLRTVAAALAAAVLLATGLAACAPADPEERLSQAVEATLAETFAYTAEITTAAGGERVPALTEIGALLQGLGVDGVRGEGAWSLRVGIFGFDVFELRSLDDDVVHFQLGLGRMLSLLGGPDADPSVGLVDDLERRGVRPAVIEVVRDGMRGEWLTVEGEIDPAELDAALGGRDVPDTDRQALVEVLGGDIRGFIDDYVVVIDVTEGEGVETFTVEVRTGALARAVEMLDPDPEPRDADLDLPETVPGTVVVRDGLITEITLDVGEEPGTGSSVVIRLTDHGGAPTPQAPERATRVDAETFLEALHALAELFSETGAPIPGR